MLPMRSLSMGILVLVALAVLPACRSTYSVNFVPLDTKQLSFSEAEQEPNERQPAGRPEERVKVAWAIRGWTKKLEDGTESDPEILVSITIKNGLSENFTLLQDRMQILDDEAREFRPRLTESDRDTRLVVPPGDAVTFRVPFTSEDEVLLERVASIRLRWTYRVGEHERDFETKFFRQSVAPGSSSPGFGLYFGAVRYGP